MSLLESWTCKVQLTELDVESWMKTICLVLIGCMYFLDGEKPQNWGTFSIIIHEIYIIYMWNKGSSWKPHPSSKNMITVVKHSGNSFRL